MQKVLISAYIEDQSEQFQDIKRLPLALFFKLLNSFCLRITSRQRRDRRNKKTILALFYNNLKLLLFLSIF